MQALAWLFTDPLIAGVAILVVAGAIFVRVSASRPLEQRVRILRGIWIAAFVVLAMWGMQQERKVQAAPTAPDAEATVAVTVKDTTRYVSPAQAFRHSATLWVLLGAGLGFAMVEMLVLRRGRGDD